MSHTLLNAIDADANGTAYTLDTDGQGEIQEVGVAAYADTWGSGTVTLQGSPDGGTTWIAITDAAFTANGYAVVKVPFPSVRAILAGATNPVDVTCILYDASTDSTVTDN